MCLRGFSSRLIFSARIRVSVIGSWIHNCFVSRCFIPLGQRRSRIDLHVEASTACSIGSLQHSPLISFKTFDTPMSLLKPHSAL